jgi:hypothetical protein
MCRRGWHVAQRFEADEVIEEAGKRMALLDEKIELKEALAWVSGDVSGMPLRRNGMQ